MSTVAVDTGSLVAYLDGRDRADTQLVHQALERGDAALPPAVVAELLSQPGLSSNVAELIAAIATLGLTPGYWRRAGETRARILSARRRARLAHTLIAQACLDHDVPLITNDSDFRSFEKIAGLRLFP